MVADYTFTETSSRNITVDGEDMRQVNYRGIDNSSIPNEKLNVDGSFVIPIVEYFTAGVEGRIPEVIKQKVVERLTNAENE